MKRGDVFDMLESSKVVLEVTARDSGTSPSRVGRRGRLRSRVRDVGSDATQVDKVVDTHVPVLSAGSFLAAVGWFEADRGLAEVVARASADEVHELTEDSVFELQFDAVDDAFEEGLEDVQRRTFQAEQTKIHTDDDGVDNDQLLHRPSSTQLQRGSKNLDRLYDVDQ